MNPTPQNSPSETSSELREQLIYDIESVFKYTTRIRLDLDVPQLADLIEKRFEAHTARLLLEAKYEVLQDLLDWHNQWFNTHDKDDPFNFYGAIKAMQVMKDPRKPFVQLDSYIPSWGEHNLHQRIKKRQSPPDSSKTGEKI